MMVRSVGSRARSRSEPPDGAGVGLNALPTYRGPVPLTSFIGRRTERDVLAGLLEGHRLVTATGPGGVGKTRLSLAVAEAVAPSFADGVGFVDLVPVADDTMVVASVADGIGVPERAGVTRTDGLLSALRDRHYLLVLDNCEHVLQGARSCIGAIVASCPRVTVLATSRTRLLLAGETVFAVPGLSLEGPGGGDAVALFATRVSAAGAGTLSDDDLEVGRAICADLDGMALAIELAAARVASFGVDGLRRVLATSHELLTVSHALDERHSSLRATIDWSYDLLDSEQQRLLRIAAVFAAPFDIESAASITGHAGPDLVSRLGQLVDWNLIGLQPGRPTRYRVLESIRQYAADRSAHVQELDELRSRHLAWAQHRVTELLARAPGETAWCDEVDAVIDDACAAATWASADDSRLAAAAALDASIAATLFQRGRVAEAQQRYELAASLTTDTCQRHEYLLLAAGSALSRYAGDEAVSLLERAATEAIQAGEQATAAGDLARVVIWRHRHRTTMSNPISAEATEALLSEARRLGAETPSVEAAIAVAVAVQEDVARSGAAGEKAIALATVTGDPLLLDAALDQLTAAQVERGDLRAAADTVAARLATITRLPIDARTGMSHVAVRLLAAHVDLGLGRLSAARRHADALAGLPFLREELHVGLARRLEVDAMAGDFDEVLRLAESFQTGWIRAGRPQVNNFGSAAYAVAMVHGMRGDEAERERVDRDRASRLPRPRRGRRRHLRVAGGLRQPPLAPPGPTGRGTEGAVHGTRRDPGQDALVPAADAALVRRVLGGSFSPRRRPRPR